MDINDLEEKIESLQSQIDETKKQNITLNAEGLKAQLDTLRQYNSAIEELQQKINNLSAAGENTDDAQEALDKLKKTRDEIDSTIRSKAGVFNKLKNEGISAVESIKYFAMSLNSVYERGQDIAKGYYSVNKSLGATGQLSKTIAANFRGAVPDITRMGGDLDDMVETYTNFTNQSGRQNVLTSDTLKNMVALSKATGLSTSESGKMYERFNLMGISMDKTHETLTELINSSNKLGVNSSKVVKVLSDNFENMQRMSFRGGVKAMTEMAKLAVQMRMDVSDMLNMAQKFYEPEAAIEAAAQLQLMGGDIAQAFGDPFETMYLARNKPEELAKRLQTMTENMLEFNEVTGEYELPAEARQQLEFAGKQLDVNADKMIDLAFQASKIKDIKMDVSGNITDDDMRETLAGMAQMKDGRWVVDVGGEQIDIADITQEQADKLKAFSDENIMKTQAQAVMTNTDALKAQTKAVQDDIAVTTNLYTLMSAGAKPLINAVGNTAGDVADTIRKDATYRELMRGSEDIIGNIANTGVNVLDNIKDFVGESYDKYIKPMSESAANQINSVSNTANNAVSNFNNNSLKSSNSSSNSSNISTNTNLQNFYNSSKKIDVSGNIDFGSLDITINGENYGSLSEAQQKQINKQITEQIMKGSNVILQAGIADGTTNVLTPEYP